MKIAAIRPSALFFAAALVLALVIAVTQLPSLLGSPVSTPVISFDKFVELADSGRLHPSVSVDSAAARCPAYTDSDNYTKRKHSITIGPDEDWVTAIETAAPDTEILLLKGQYSIDRHAVLVDKPVTIRSADQDSKSVTISGRGYGESGEGFMIMSNDITIADITITAMRDHAIAIKPRKGAQHNTQIYNVHLYDIGTQHIKLNVGGSSGGLVACSSIGYTAEGARGDYNGAIDLHEASSWTVRDNTIYNIRGDGSGCNVDRDCGRYISGPAILVWNKSRDTRITRNRIFDSYRNIAIGLGRGHNGGHVDNNLIVQSRPGDAGIELQTARDTLVENNTVILSGAYRGAIEYRQSSSLVIRNNQLTSTPYDRGGNQNISVQDNSVNPALFSQLTATTRAQ